MSNILISGSMAFDVIMNFEGYFKDHILAEKIHSINVAFLVPQMRREYGGCAGNIAYNLKLLGGKPLIMATVGSDFSPYYAMRLTGLRIPQVHIKQITDSFTAQAFITTDLSDNQITAFHPGAMVVSQKNHVSEAKNVSLGIVAPAGKEGMIQHAQELKALNIPFVFDPGQGLPMFNGEELSVFIDQATYITVNDYEGAMLQEKTGLSFETIASKVKALIVTRGGDGSDIYTDGKVIHVPSVKINQVIDPTGCGDAYRAGLLYGIQRGFTWEQIGRLASVLGGIKIESKGGQNHYFVPLNVEQRYEENYGESISITPIE